MIIIVIKCGNSRLQKIFFAAVIVFKIDKCVVMAEQHLQLFRVTGCAGIEIQAILGIATLV